MYINRSLENKVEYMADHFPVILVSGARQVGKTTLLKKITEGKNAIQYVTLDHPRVRRLAKEDPELFLQQYSAPVIIDEIQYAPELLPFIKIKGNYSAPPLLRALRVLRCGRTERFHRLSAPWNRSDPSDKQAYLTGS